MRTQILLPKVLNLLPKLFSALMLCCLLLVAGCDQANVKEPTVAKGSIRSGIEPATTSGIEPTMTSGATTSGIKKKSMVVGELRVSAPGTICVGGGYTLGSQTGCGEGSLYGEADDDNDTNDANANVVFTAGTTLTINLQGTAISASATYKGHGSDNDLWVGYRRPSANGDWKFCNAHSTVPAQWTTSMPTCNSLNYCGDGFKGDSEQCDSDPHCSNSCMLLPYCGDTIKNNEEECDGTNYCTSQCKLNVCGDGYRMGNETCDDGNTNNGDACSNSCTINPYCGDGIINVSNGKLEQCDDHNLSNGDGCSSTCTLELDIPPSVSVAYATGDTIENDPQYFYAETWYQWVPNYSGGNTGNPVSCTWYLQNGQTVNYCDPYYTQQTTSSSTGSWNNAVLPSSFSATFSNGQTVTVSL